MRSIRLTNTDFEGKNNIYVVGEPGAITLVDTGMATNEIREQLIEGLAAYDLTVEDIERVLLTHWHPDHVGLAGELEQENDASIYIHENDAPLVRNRAWGQMEPIYSALFDEWGMPADKRAELDERFKREDEALSGRLTDANTFVDGDTFDCGEFSVTVIHAPGHTAGLSCFAFDGAAGRELFSGDAVLPVYTPNVGGADVRVEHALERYLETLERLIDGAFDRAWPGHRDPIEDPTARAKEILAHHRDRTGRIVSVLRERGPCDAWTVSTQLFGELYDIHILHGPGEAYAHLDHLHHYGVVEQTSDGYDLVSSAEIAVDELFPASI